MAGAAGAAADSDKMEHMMTAVRRLLTGIGEDVNREGLVDTPKRVAKALLYMTGGYIDEPSSVLCSALFHEPLAAQPGAGMVVVRDIDFASTCESTLLPFHGRVHIGYLPSNGVVLGLSKMSRLTSIFARRLQTQERLGTEILDALMTNLKPKGVAILVEAKHLSQAENSAAVTTVDSRGCFQEDSPAWREFAALLGMQGVTVPVPGPSGTAHVQARTNGTTTLYSTDSPASPDSGSESAGSSPRSTAVSREDMVSAMEVLLEAIGEDVNREGLAKSKERYVEWFLRTTEGNRSSASTTLPRGASFCMEAAAQVTSMDIQTSECAAPATPEAQDNSCTAVLFQPSPAPSACPASNCVVMRIPFASQCEHHLLPFYGTATLALVPSHPAAAATLPGMVEMRSLVRMYSRRLQIQERLTSELAEAVEKITSGRLSGLLVVCDAAHMCMVARGVEKAASGTLSYAARGCLQENSALRAQVMKALSSKLPKPGCQHC